MKLVIKQAMQASPQQVQQKTNIFFLFLDQLGLKKWVEVGNSGVFRPEMLLPMGLPEDVSVIAWGLSLER